MRNTVTKLDTREVAEQLRKFMDELTLDVDQIHKKSGVARSTIYAILGGDRDTTQRQTVNSILEVFGYKCVIKGNRIFFEKVNILNEHSRQLEQLEQTFNEIGENTGLPKLRMIHTILKNVKDLDPAQLECLESLVELFPRLSPQALGHVLKTAELMTTNESSATGTKNLSKTEPITI